MEAIGLHTLLVVEVRRGEPRSVACRHREHDPPARPRLPAEQHANHAALAIEDRAAARAFRSVAVELDAMRMPSTRHSRSTRR